MNGKSILTFPVHLGLGATAVAEPAFTGDINWYQAYVDRHLADGTEGRLVSMHTFDRSWEWWEMHPHGSELVLCTSGQITLLQEHSNGSLSKIVLDAGQYAVNPPLVWHTADVQIASTAVFITAGFGTQHRVRE